MLRITEFIDSFQNCIHITTRSFANHVMIQSVLSPIMELENTARLWSVWLRLSHRQILIV